MKCILRRHVAAITATTLLAFGFAETADALDDVDTDPLVKESVWYDAENAQLRSVEVKPQVDDSIHRDSRWLAKPQQVREQTAPAATGTGRATGTGYTIANIFGWTLIGVFVVVMTILMFLLLRKLDTEGNISSDRQQAHDSSGLDAATQQRIKHLPAELRRTGVNLRDEAARLMAAEQFDQAMILLFGHQLLLLDRAGSLRLSRGKTTVPRARLCVRQPLLLNGPILAVTRWVPMSLHSCGR